MQHCGISYTEAWEMPVSVRRWWLRQKAEQDKKKGPPEGGPAVPRVVLKR